MREAECVCVYMCINTCVLAQVGFLFKRLFSGLFCNEIFYETFKTFIQFPLIAFYENSAIAEVYYWSNPEHKNGFASRLWYIQH